MKKRPRIIIILLYLGLLSCNPDKNKFYNDNGGFDFNRIPLIYPYEARLTNPPYWYIAGAEVNSSRPIIGDIKSFDVIDSIIVGRYSDTSESSNGEIVEKNVRWYLIIPSSGKEMKFKSDNSFYAKFSNYSDKKITLKNCDDVLKKFKDDEYLDWFPDDYKTKSKYRKR